MKEELMISPGLGAYKDIRDNRDFRLASVQAPVALPGSFTLLDQFQCNNQYSRGSCTSQAQAHHKERQEGSERAARFIMAVTKHMEGNSEYGAYTRNTFKAVQEVGACAQTLYPEPGPEMSWEEYIDYRRIPLECFADAGNHRSQSYWRVDNAAEALKQAIFQNKNSVVISMAWYKDFNNPGKDGLIREPNQNNYVGGHAVEVEGWNDDARGVIIKNSWGNGWGTGGRFILPYELFEFVWDAWCSLDLPADMPVDLRYGQQRTWTKYVEEKKQAFNPWLRAKIKRLPNNREINGLVYGYWGFETVFQGKNGDLWLKMTKPEAIKQGLIK